MLGKLLTLEGRWKLRDNVDDNPVAETSHAEFYSDIYSCHFAREDESVLSIRADVFGDDTLTFTYESQNGSCTRDFLMDHFNIFFPNSMNNFKSTAFGSVIAFDAAAGTWSLLVIGPLPGQRVIEKYCLEGDGMQLNVKYFISSIDGDFQVVRKYDRQKEDDKPSEVPAILQIGNGVHPVNNWKRVKSHNSTTLQSLQIEVSVEGDFQPPSESPQISDNAITMYRIEVQLPAKDNQPLKSWSILYRYSYFRALWKFLCSELTDIRDSTAKQVPDMPPFPPKWPFVKSESSLNYRCKGLQHFLCGIISQGGYEPYVGSRAANIVDLLSAFLEVPRHFASEVPTSAIRNSINSVHYCQSVYHTAIGGEKRGINAEVQGLLAKSSQAKCNSSVATAPVFVIVNGARNRKAPMFPNFGDCVTLLVRHVLPATFRVEDNASRSVYRRYKDISNWFQNILEILSVSHSSDVLSRLNLPAKKGSHVNTISSSSKTDINGNFVKYRIAELQKSIQSLLTEFPVVVSLPLSQEFFELHKFPPIGESVSEENEKSC